MLELVLKPPSGKASPVVDPDRFRSYNDNRLERLSALGQDRAPIEGRVVPKRLVGRKTLRAFSLFRMELRFSRYEAHLTLEKSWKRMQKNAAQD